MVVVGVVKERSVLERLDIHQLKVETSILIAHLMDGLSCQQMAVLLATTSW